MAEPPTDRDDVGVLTAGVLRFVNGIRRLPADLAFVVGIVLLADLVALTPVLRETVLPPLFGVAFLLFAPGYAFLAALFPEGNESSELESGSERASEPVETSPGIGGVERVALSLGLSVAITPFVGLLLDLSPWNLELVPVLVGLSVVTLCFVVVAARRRRALPVAERFRVPYRRWLADARAGLLSPASRGDLVVNVLFVASVVIALSAVGWATFFPQQGESMTAFSLYTESGDGGLVAQDYPTEYAVGGQRELVLRVENREHRPVRYRVLVRLQNVSLANDSATVLRSDRLTAFRLRLEHGETWGRRHAVEPTFSGTRLRLQYLLYRGDLPQDPTAESAYRELHLWINVTSP